MTADISATLQFGFLTISVKYNKDKYQSYFCTYAANQNKILKTKPGIRIVVQN